MYYVLYIVVAVHTVGVIESKFSCDLLQGQRIFCNSDTDAISLKCPTAHKLFDLQANAYRQQSAIDCPKAFDSRSSCEFNDVGTSMTQELQACTGNQSCTSVKLNPISNSFSCLENGFTGSMFFVVTYVCKPDIVYEKSEVAVTPLSMNEAEEISASSLIVNSISSAPRGNFIGRLDTGCTVDLPAGSSLLVRLNYFEKKSPRNSCDQLIYLEHGKESHRLCSKNDTPIDLSCDESDKQISVRYSTNNNNISVVFEMYLEVPLQYRMKVRCGVPMKDDPLLTPSGGPYITEEVAGRAIVIGCVLGSLVIIVIAVLIIEIRKRKSRQMYSIYEYHATTGKVDSAVETSEPAFVMESDKKVLVEDSPTVQYSAIY